MILDADFSFNKKRDTHREKGDAECRAEQKQRQLTEEKKKKENIMHQCRF